MKKDEKGMGPGAETEAVVVPQCEQHRMWME